MGRIGWFGVGVMVVATITGFAVYSTAMAVNNCLLRARDAIDRADPFDRNPLLSVVRIVEREVGRDRLAEVLSTVLLERLDCAAGRTDWLTLRPTLSWQLQRSFSESERVALFTSTLDTGAGKLGLREGLRRYYAYEGQYDLPPTWPECLIRKAIGTIHQPCGNEGVYWPVP